MWRRLEEPEVIHYLPLKGRFGFEVVEENGTVIIGVKRGIAFCGRPLCRWIVWLKGRKLKGGRVKVTYWNFEFEVLCSPTTAGFGIFFPEVLDSAWQEPDEEEKLEAVLEVLDELSSF